MSSWINAILRIGFTACAPEQTRDFELLVLAYPGLAMTTACPRNQSRIGKVRFLSWPNAAVSTGRNVALLIGNDKAKLCEKKVRIE